MCFVLDNQACSVVTKIYQLLNFLFVTMDSEGWGLKEPKPLLI